MTILASLTGGAIGGVVGYRVGAIVGCDGLYSTSNLCGIYGAVFTDPVGIRGLRTGGLVGHAASPA